MQRETFPDLPRVRFSCEQLGAAAVTAQNVAMTSVFMTHGSEPIMGLTRHSAGSLHHQSQYDRHNATDAYDGDVMLTHITDCQSASCLRIDSRQRFDVQAVAGPVRSLAVTLHEVKV